MNEVEAFYQYLGAQLHLGPPTESPETILENWRKQREYHETVEAVREGVRDMEAGRMRSVKDLLGEIEGRPEAAR